MDRTLPGRTLLTKKRGQKECSQHLKSCNAPFGFVIFECSKAVRLQHLVVEPPDLMFLAVWSSTNESLAIIRGTSITTKDSVGHREMEEARFSRGRGNLHQDPPPV